MIPLLLALPALVRGAGELLGMVDHPAAAAAVAALSNVSAAIDTSQITPDQLAPANDHLEKMRQIEAAQATAEQGENADTMRAEIVSGDGFVRRMRPTFGYAMAFSWTVQMMAVSYAMVFNPMLAVQIIAAMSQLTPLWGIALAVLGIYTYGRTQEKKAALEGDASLIRTVPEAIGGIVGAVAGGSAGGWAALAGKVERSQ